MASTIFLLDYVSKTLASQLLGSGAHPVLGSLLQLELINNSGAAFSVATNSGIFLGVLSISAVAGIFLFSRSITSRLWAYALGLLLGGVLGNLSDRLFRAPYWLRGSVVDWIKLPHWPVFNLADSSIVLSAVAIALLVAKNVKPRTFDDN